MILYPPERFDTNEWFPILAFVFSISVCLMLPKRFSLISITVFIVFTVFLSQSVDSLIAVQPFDLYDVSDMSKYEIMDVFIYYLNYPPVTYLFLYGYDKWKWKGLHRVLYVLGASFITFLLEWAAYLCHVFTYKGWKLLYSPVIYVGVYTLYILMYHAIQKLLHSDDKTTNQM